MRKDRQAFVVLKCNQRQEAGVRGTEAAFCPALLALLLINEPHTGKSDFSDSEIFLQNLPCKTPAVSGAEERKGDSNISSD